MTLVLRTSGEPAALANAVRQRVRAVDPDQPVARIETMSAAVARSLGTTRLSTILFGLFGVVGLVLAAVGIYGVISYGVLQRTREFGLRMALGARPSDVRGMVVRQAAVLTALGVGIGLVCALVGTRLMRTLLFSVTPADPLSYVVVVVVLGGVALLASYLPARRATRVDPVIALRNE
jgi:putative ABC transport system permease protein